MKLFHDKFSYGLRTPSCPHSDLFFTNQAFFLEFCPVSFLIGFLIHFGESRFEVGLNICPHAVCSTIYQVWRPNHAPLASHIHF